MRSSHSKLSEKINNIRYNEKYFRAITENMPGGVAIIDDKGKIIYASPSGQRILGYDINTLLGKSILDIIDTEYQENALNRIAELLAEPGKVTSYDYKVRHKDGSYRWLAVTGTNLIEDPSIGGIILNYYDVTNIKKASKRKKFLTRATAVLSESLDFEESMRNVARLSVPTIADWCAIYTTEDGATFTREVLVHARESEEKNVDKLLSTYPEDPRTYLPVASILNGTSLLYENLNKEAVEQYTEEGFNSQLAIKLIKRLKIGSLIVSPIKRRDSFLGFMVFAVEKGKKYDKDDLDFVDDFAKRAGMILDNSKMYGQLQYANQMKDEFLASLAHELRNPLAPIMHSLDFLRLQKNNSSPEINNELDVIERQARNMTRLLDDLLDVSRITEGRLKLRKRVVDVGQVVEHAVQTSRPFFEAREHEFSIVVPEKPVYLEADPLRLEQIVVNLLSNAAKYTKPGGKIKLVCEYKDEEIYIKVKDNGIGIDPAALNDIFRSFVKIDKRIDRHTQEGLGVGLKLAKKLTELQGGSISAHSEGANKGSEFTVRFPARRKAEKNPAAYATAGPNDSFSRRVTDAPTESVKDISSAKHQAKQERQTNKTTQKILVVDDNKDAANALGRVLEKLGYNVEITHDGESALKKVQSYTPALILLDIGLPVMSGYEVAQKIRKLEKGHGIVLVALTGYGQEEDKLKAKEAGFDWHITKPVGVAELKNVLDKELGTN